MADYKSALINGIQAKKAVVAVYGLGYVGLPLALRFAEAGFQVIGFDVDLKKVELLNAGKSYIERIPDLSIRSAREKGFRASNDYEETTLVDACVICVPTPLGKHKDPDLSYIRLTMDGLIPHLKKGQLISLESTTYPGTTEEVLLPLLTDTGFEVGNDFFLAYSPEREDPGNEQFSTQTIPKICAGHTSRCLEVAQALYQSIIDRVVSVSSTKVAEMTKLLENIYRAVNIGLVNELKIVADKMGIDIHEVVTAAATKPFGFTPFFPGPGLGGHCIPIDPFYLSWKAKEFDVSARFIELAGEINSNIPDWVIGKIVLALNEQEKSVNNSNLLILGIAYKKNVDDMRESPSLYIMNRLLNLGANVEYSDPHIPRLPSLRKYSIDRESLPLDSETLGRFDAAIVLTDHDRFDFEFISRHVPLIIDTRGAIQTPTNATLVRA